MIARPTFALPHLADNQDNDLAARKRQYGRDLQEQVKDNLRRKDQEWRGNAPQKMVAKQLLALPKGYPPVDPLIPAINSAITPLDALQHISGTDMMSVLRKWEQLFAGQAMQSATMVGNLNKRVAELESQLVEQSRDKQYLRERQDLLETAQGKQNRSYFEIEAAVKAAERMREKESKDVNSDIESIRTATESALSKLADAVAASQQKASDLHERLHDQTAQGQTLAARLSLLEQSAVGAHEDLKRVKEHGESWARAAADAQAGLSARLAAAESRLDRVERVAVPEAQGRADQLVQRHSAAVDEELAALRRAVQELQARSAAREASAEGRLREVEGGLERLASSAVRAAEGAAGADPGRLRELEQAVENLSARSAGAQAQARGEVGALFEQLAATVREADARHSRLVEGLVERTGAQLAAQGEAVEAVEAALRGERARLEEFVRLEVEGRAGAMDILKAQLESRIDAALHEARQVREELSAQVQAAGSRARAAGRAARALAAECEEFRRAAAAEREPLASGLAAVEERQRALEDGLRSQFQAGTADLQQQIEALRQLCASSSGGAQERADAVGQDLAKGLADLRAQVEGLDGRVAGLSEAHAAAKSRLEGDVLLLQGGQARAAEGLSTQGAALFERLREARGELLQRMDSQRAQAEELHQRALEAVRLAEARAAAQAAGLGARADAGERAVEALRRDVEERGREAQALVSGATAQLLQSIEAKAAHAQGQALHFQAELDRLRQGQAEAGERFMRHAEDAEAWRAAAEGRMEAAAQEGRRAAEAAAAEGRRLQEELGEQRRESGARLSRLDAKLVEDMRRILQAIQLHKEAHERLRAGTDARLADLAREEAEELERVWAELAALRELARRARDEGAGDVAGLQRLLQSASKDLQAEIDREAAARAEADESLRAALAAEAKSRAEGEGGLRRDLGALGEARQRGDDELSARLDSLRAETQAGTGALVARVEALASGTEGELAGLQVRAEEAAREREALGAAVDRLRALTNDSLAALRAEDARLAGLADGAAAATRAERLERDAAVAEVYRRMEVARQTESLLQQVQEGEWAARLERLEGRLRASAESGARSAVAQAREMQDEADRARRRDLAEVSAGLDALREGARAAAQRVDEVRRELSGEIDGLALKVLSGGEAAAAEQTKTLARMEEEHRLLRGEIERGGAETEALRAALQQGEAERRAEAERLAKELGAEAEARAAEGRRMEEALRADMKAGEEGWRAAADALSMALKAEEAARTSECGRLGEEVKAEAAARAERDTALEALIGAQTEALEGHGARIQGLEEAAAAARAGGAQTAEETAARLAEVAAELERQRAELEGKAGREQVETKAGEDETRVAELRRELEGILATVRALEAGQESSARELEALEGRTGAAAAAEAQRATDTAAARAAALEERLAGLEADCARAAALVAVGERVDAADARLRAVEADYAKAEAVSAVSERADAADKRLAALEGDWVKGEQLKALSGRVDAADARLAGVEGDYVKSEQLQGVREKFEAVDARLAAVEADYAKAEQVRGLEARVQAAEAEAARAAKLEVRVEQAETLRGGDLKRVTAAEEQLKVLGKTVEGLKGKGKLTDEELSAMKPVQDLAAEVKRVEGLLGPAAEAAAAEVRRVEGRVDELAASKASAVDLKFEANKAANEMETLKGMRKADLESLSARIGALERAKPAAGGGGDGAGADDGLRAEVKKLEEGLAAARKATDDAEGALHMRIDKLMVDELRKASNVQAQTLDKLDKKVRKLKEAVKALEELASLHDGDGEADAGGDAGAGG